jgi:hypothetical protein
MSTSALRARFECIFVFRCMRFVDVSSIAVSLPRCRDPSVGGHAIPTMPRSPGGRACDSYDAAIPRWAGMRSLRCRDPSVGGHAICPRLCLRIAELSRSMVGGHATASNCVVIAVACALPCCVCCDPRVAGIPAGGVLVSGNRTGYLWGTFVRSTGGEKHARGVLGWSLGEW